jgi:hemolysin D
LSLRHSTRRGRCSDLEIEASVSNRDIGFVSAGQEAEIKVDAFNFARYGRIHGKASSISRGAVVYDRRESRATAPTGDIETARPECASLQKSRPDPAGSLAILSRRSFGTGR